MIELYDDELAFSFPDVHPQAKLNIVFQRTLRIPDDGKSYPLPPGLGAFPVQHVDDYAKKLPSPWLQRGGVMLPIYQSEAMWLCFESTFDLGRGVEYPFAIKVAAGKINAVTGQSWSNELHREPQDYVVAPPQPWLDGYCVEAGTIRQFVAMPLGKGYSAEEQITGKGEFGGLQLIVYPLKRAVYEQRFPEKVILAESAKVGEVGEIDDMELTDSDHALQRDASDEDDFDDDEDFDLVLSDSDDSELPGSAQRSIGLAPGGQMNQQICSDSYNLDDWDTEHCSRCFIHLVNAEAWHTITGHKPPTLPPTAKVYSQYGLPWFEFYAEGTNQGEGSSILNKLKSVHDLGQLKDENPLLENESCEPERVVKIVPKRVGDTVREGTF